MSGLFVSYPGDLVLPVASVCHCLSRQSNVEYYFHPEQRTWGTFRDTILKMARERKWFVLFVSERSESSDWQQDELKEHLDRNGMQGVLVVLVDGCKSPAWLTKTREKKDEFDYVKPAARSTDPGWAHEV